MFILFYLSYHVSSANTLLYNGYYKTDESVLDIFVIKPSKHCVNMSCMILITCLVK